MKTAEDIDAYLLKLGTKVEQSTPGTWVLDLDGKTLAVSIAGPVIAFRMKVMDLPKGDRQKLYETLLQLNTSDMVHGAYGVEQNAVVMVDALQFETLDYGEFAAVVDEFGLAVARHYPQLTKFRPSA